MVARIMLENIQRVNEGDVLETRAEDFNAIDHDGNPRRNERCEEEEPAISRGMSQRELPESEGRRAVEEASNIAESPEVRVTSTKADKSSRMVIQKKQIKTKSSARKSKETSKTDEAIELTMLDEHAMIYSLTEDPDPKIQQCYAYYRRKRKEFPIPSHIFRPPCMPCAGLFAKMDDDTETGYLCEKQGTGSVQVAANVKACKSCAGRRGPCKMNDMPVLLRGISKLMSEPNFYFHDTNRMTPFPTGWVYVEARYFELRSRPDVGFIEAIRATQQCSIKIDGVRSQVEGQVSRIMNHIDARLFNLESLVHDAISGSFPCWTSTNGGFGA
ncbi:hypothetical protein BFJ72_g12630 [Fusarium proliferatum]|uniref:Uncharacterized protein n=1 Tax=Gibberella intermedia TaxID=948311 RepID=A0A420SFX9_GIBIN|nr:hypothetical protein BFJ72_g12630 [Fusarium proliferatum]